MRARRDSLDNGRTTKSEGAGSKRKRGWDRRAGEGRERGPTVSTAATERRWQGEMDDYNSGGTRQES
eukprot:7918226-Pyramimonas_sp.AAC.1